MDTHQELHSMLQFAANNPKVTGIKLSVRQYVRCLEAGGAELLLNFSTRKLIRLRP